MLNSALRGAIAAGGAGEPEQPPDLPYFGRFYGQHSVCQSAGNWHIRDADGVGWFFCAPRDGTINQFRWNRRTGDGYSLGDGGNISVRIWPADPDTKLPITTATPLSELLNYQPRNDRSTQSSPAAIGGNPEWPVMAFGSVSAPLVRGQPYVVQFRPMDPPDNANYVSANNISFWTDDPSTTPGPYEALFFPTFLTLPNGSEQYPYSTFLGGGQPVHRRVGDFSINLRYSDGVWFGNPSVAQSGHTAGESYPSPNNRWGVIWGAQNMEMRDRRRVTRANRIVDGVWIRIAGFQSTTGALIFRLEDHGTDSSDTSGNGTLLKEVSAPASSFKVLTGNYPGNGAPERWNELDANYNTTDDQVTWVFLDFEQQITLEVGRIYNGRFRSPNGRYGWLTGQRCEHNNPQWSPLSVTWEEHEANRTLPWEDEDSRGVQYSLNAGSTWNWLGGNLRKTGPILYRCVT
jgi:hypothetical protein